MPFFLASVVGCDDEDSMVIDAGILGGLHDAAHKAVGFGDGFIVGWCVVPVLVANVVDAVKAECSQVGTLLLDVFLCPLAQHIGVLLVVGHYSHPADGQ